MRSRKSSGKVLDLRMEEGSGAVAGDSSRYGNDGAVNGGVVWTEQGMRFDGSSGYLDCGNDESLRPIKAISISAWVYYVGGNTNQGIVSTSEDATKGYFLVRRSDGRARFSIGTGAASIADIDSDVALQIDKWYHIVVTYDGSETKMFVDSIEQIDIDIAGGNMGTWTNTYIGSLSSLLWYFNGSIDNPQICNRALSAREIQKQYNAAKYKYE